MTVGCFVVFEGGEGSGKTTQVDALARRLHAARRRCLVTKEPGGTALGEQVRAILLHARDLPMTPRAELLLFAASRAQLVETVIRPELTDGVDVICDRYLYSSVAYQGYGRGLDLDLIEQINVLATDRLLPDLVVLLDLPVESGLARKGKAEWTRFEDEAQAFHRRVREGYLALARDDPRRWLVLDAALPPAVLADLIWGRVEAAIADPSPEVGGEPGQG